MIKWLLALFFLLTPITTMANELTPQTTRPGSGTNAGQVLQPNATSPLQTGGGIEQAPGNQNLQQTADREHLQEFLNQPTSGSLQSTQQSSFPPWWAAALIIILVLLV